VQLRSVAALTHCASFPDQGVGRSRGGSVCGIAIQGFANAGVEFEQANDLAGLDSFERSELVDPVAVRGT
jgi:hypothetical protein